MEGYLAREDPSGSIFCRELYSNDLIADDKWNRKDNFQKGWGTQCSSWFHVYEGIFPPFRFNQESYSFSLESIVQSTLHEYIQT